MAEEEVKEEMQEEVKDEGADIASFDPTKKKKKKKKEVMFQEPANDSVDDLAEKAESLTVSDNLEASFTGLKKKKKKPVQVPADASNDEMENTGDEFDDHFGDDDGAEGIVLQQYPWEGTDRDYLY